MLEVTMLKKYGPENLAAHYGEFDTICDATQVTSSLHAVVAYLLSEQSVSLPHTVSLLSDFYYYVFIKDRVSSLASHREES